MAGLAIAGEKPVAEIARDFGVNVHTVEAIARSVKGIDPVQVAEIRRALPDVLSLLAAAHATKALEKLDDPNASVRHTFGSKLAVEAGRVAQPGAEAPGQTVLAFINQLKIHAAPPAEVIVNAPPAAIAIPEFEPVDAGAGDVPGPTGGAGGLDWGAGADDVSDGGGEAAG